jgi:uncharacterized protein
MTNSALIIFAKLPRAGEVKTRLGKSIGMEKAVEVYKHFAEHAFTLADNLHSKGVDVFVLYGPGAKQKEVAEWVARDFFFTEQQGTTLGDRMHHAFDLTFASGAMQSVIIGTDVPELDARTIQEGFESLAKHDIVLGPSNDGGYYLLGMNAPTKNVFAGITWSVETVSLQTITRIQSLQLSYHLLPKFSDIDTEKDLDKYLRRRTKLPTL